MIRVHEKLGPYRRKRHFDQTPEPAPRAAAKHHAALASGPRFVIQKHNARRLHYDLRLEDEGVLKSWALPKGPSLNPEDKRLAVRTEDHPLEYIDFEGVIPEGEYGAGEMIVWDTGTYRDASHDSRGREIPLRRALERGSARLWLEGSKLRGGFALVRSRSQRRSDPKEQWLLIKLDDEYARPDGDVDHLPPHSVLSERTIEDLGADRARRRGQRNRTSARKSNGRDDAAAVPTTPQPEWIDPMLATLADDPAAADGPDWLYESKLDGIRALAFRRDNDVRLYSRNRKLLNARYPEIVEALRKQPLTDFVIDGELIAFDAAGRTGFAQIQKRMMQVTLEQVRRAGVQVYYAVFDLLHANGYDARPLPLRQRKALLEQAIVFQEPIRPVETLTAPEGGSRALLDSVCGRGEEGLIAKLADGPYETGRRARGWLKLKCTNQQEFVIGGWTKPRGSRSRFGALLVGYYEDGKLRYAGKVGAGFDESTLDAVFAELEKIARKSSPFTDDVPERTAHWVKPKLVAQVAFGEWTRDGRLRHPRFLGLRLDKEPKKVVRERAEQA